MQAIANTAALEELLSRPSDAAVLALAASDGDCIVLGAGGKIGPTLARMLRAGLNRLGLTSRKVIAVSRFSSESAARSLSAAGIEVIPCDLTRPEQIANLPDAPNVFYLVGQKFGTAQSPETTWVINTVVPALIAQRYCRSRIVALSTGCVYPFVPVDGPGANEDYPLTPLGEYANSCVGRERVLQYYSHANQTPLVLVRLCYAIDLRYGLLLDLAQQVYQEKPIDISVSATHVIWQGDANDRIIRCLARASYPPVAVNLTGLERLSIRSLASRLGELLQRSVTFVGKEETTAWLWDASKSYEWFGPPEVSIEKMLQLTAQWVQSGGSTHNLPTHFEVRDGKF